MLLLLLILPVLRCETHLRFNCCAVCIESEIIERYSSNMQLTMSRAVKSKLTDCDLLAISTLALIIVSASLWSAEHNNIRWHLAVRPSLTDHSLVTATTIGIYIVLLAGRPLATIVQVPRRAAIENDS